MTSDECLDALRDYLRLRYRFDIDWSLMAAARQASPDADALLLIDRHCRRRTPLTVQAEHRWLLAERCRLTDWQHRLDPDAFARAQADHKARMEAVFEEARINPGGTPPSRSPKVAVWVACCVCGGRPLMLDPLPDGWIWDNSHPEDWSVWCPECRTAPEGPRA